uniref:AVID protein n=1 Tax=Sphenodon punctatus TaxID=8508 RepID=A0A8D0LB70_SPHPU
MIMGEVACSLMLTLLCSITGESGGKRKCDLSGMWVNDLGSKMVLSPVNEVGEFAGSYLTAVTASPNRILESPLKGSQHPTKKRAHPTFGFTVTWQHSGSEPTFSRGSSNRSRGTGSLTDEPWS